MRGRHFTLPEVAAAMAAYAVPEGGGRVLDPACGAGALLAEAGDRGAAERVGVDTDGEALGAARQALGSGVRLVEGDFLTLPSDDLGGLFDAVLANPPYLRQESIPAARKRELRARHAHELARPGAGRTDLLGYFLLELTRHLRPGGRLAFLSSAAWLTSRYGAPLRAFLIRNYRVDQVLESAVEPWFPEARTRAVLVLAERTSEPRDDGDVRFVRLTGPTGCAHPEGRRIPASRLVDGRPWGTYLRLPSVLEELQARLPGGFRPLGELAQARFGLKTGADRFFLFRDGTNGLGQDWTGPAGRLRPIVVSPMELDRLTIDPTALPRRVMVASPEDDRLPEVSSLLREAESPPHALHRRASCRPRERADGTSRWFTVPPGPAAPVVWTRTVQYRHLVSANPDGVLVNNNLIALQPRDGVGIAPLLASLNSGWTFLERYARGRVSNEGKVKTEVGDLASLCVPDPRRLTSVDLAPIDGRPIGRLDLELDRQDRRGFEQAVLVALGLPPAEAAGWVERLGQAVVEIAGWERRWESAFHAGRGRPTQQ